jgi:hypothetical protein
LCYCYTHGIQSFRSLTKYRTSKIQINEQKLNSHCSRTVLRTSARASFSKGGVPLGFRAEKVDSQLALAPFLPLTAAGALSALAHTHTFSSVPLRPPGPIHCSCSFKSSLSFQDSSNKDGRARSDTSRRGPAILRGRREAARGLVHPQRRQGGLVRPAQNSQVR